MFVSLLAFTLAAALLTVTPGVDTANVLRAAALGPRAGFAAALGVCGGLAVWGTAAAFGLGALLAASAVAFMALKFIGAAYLAILGLKLILRPRDGFDATGGEAPAPAAVFLRRGFLANVLNPKVGVFYATFLPQFVPPGRPVAAFSLALAAVHAALSLTWFALLIAATRPLSAWLRRPRVARSIDRLTGGVFLAFGAKLALARA